MKRSLPEVHASVLTASPSIFKRIFAFAGPAYLVAVGYMDPGNWATDLEGGARFTPTSLSPPPRASRPAVRH